jgi:hypothetical protein
MADDSAPEAEARFRDVFVHLPEVVAYARRRGSRDPEAVGAEGSSPRLSLLNRIGGSRCVDSFVLPFVVIASTVTVSQASVVE